MKKIMFNDKFGLTDTVLYGEKTITISPCKYNRPDESYDIVFPIFEPKDYDNDGNIISKLDHAFGWRNKEGDFVGWNIPKYKIGEVVAVAQSYADCGNMPDCEFDEEGYPIMPDQIRITDVRISQLQNISDEDCLKSGIIENIYKIPTKAEQYIINYYPCKYDKECAQEVGWGITYNTPKGAFSVLIDKVYGEGTWASNPYVFVYEFELTK